MESHMLCVRVSEEDYKTIQRMAREQHWSMNVFLKNLILENLNGVEQAEKSLWKEKEMEYMQKYIECSINNILQYTLDNLGLEIGDLVDQVSKLEQQIKILQKETGNVKCPRSRSWKRR